MAAEIKLSKISVNKFKKSLVIYLTNLGWVSIKSVIEVRLVRPLSSSALRQFTHFEIKSGNTSENFLKLFSSSIEFKNVTKLFKDKLYTKGSLSSK